MDADGTAVQGFTRRDVLTWFRTSVALLEDSQDLLNRSNVFPVADSDTGTNMLLTVRGALNQAQTEASGDGAVALASAAIGALRNAHGNSGIILAEYLRGFSTSYQARSSILSTESAAEALTVALELGARQAYKAVALPVEGTILTAASYAALRARETVDSLELGDSSSVLSVLDAAILGASQALDRSHLDLEVLAQSGFLDAGAYGLVLVLSALRSVYAEEPATTRSSLSTEVEGAVRRGAEATGTDGEFEVTCLVELRTTEDIDDDLAERITTSLRTVLAQLGESVVVSGGTLTEIPAAVPNWEQPQALWNVHVHTENPDHVLTALEQVSPNGLGLTRIVVRNLRQQMIANAAEHRPLNLLVCVNGPLLAVDLSRLGAIVCIERTQALSLEDVERAISELHHDNAPRQLAPGSQGDSNRMDQGVVVITHSESLAQQLATSHLGVGLVRAFDDVQVVGAASAVVSEWELNQPDLDRLVRAGRECIGKLVTIRIELLERATMAPLINELEPEHQDGNIPVVTVLTDVGCPANAVLDLVDGIERVNQDAEVIVLSSGRPGRGLTASVEWIDE